jgi:hypothetical protein
MMGKKNEHIQSGSNHKYGSSISCRWFGIIAINSSYKVRAHDGQEKWNSYIVLEKKKKVDRDGLFQFRCLYQEARKYRGEFHV